MTEPTAEEIEAAEKGIEELRTLRDEIDGAIELTEGYIEGKITKEKILEYDAQSEELCRL